jgi:hypothetical protein
LKAIRQILFAAFIAWNVFYLDDAYASQFDPGYEHIVKNDNATYHIAVEPTCC